MSKKLLAPAYMHEFKCLGGDCEDTCCQNWDIRLDEKHYNLLAEAFSGDVSDKSTFDKNVKLFDEKNANERNFAYIKVNESGFCPFLNQHGLCHIHAEFGVEPLSNVCTFFPRVFSIRNKLPEMTGALSCPEMVRRCLFSSGQDYEFSAVSRSILPRADYPVSHRLESTGNFYHEKFSDVNAQLISLINDDQYAFETRMYFLANFTYRLAPHYHNGCEDKQKLIDEEIVRMRSYDIKKQLDEYFYQFTTTEPVAMIIVQSILQLRIQYEGGDKLSKFASQIFERYKTDILSSDDFDVFGENVPPDILWKKFQVHWEKLNSRFGAQLEIYFTRYVTNCLQREWFIGMPDPFVYIHMLSIRLAVLRFLLTSHPNMIALLNPDLSESTKQTDEEMQQAFNEIVVEVVYLFARSIDHNHNFLQVIFHAMLEQQMMSFDYSLPLLKF